MAELSQPAEPAAKMMLTRDHSALNRIHGAKCAVIVFVALSKARRPPTLTLPAQVVRLF